MSGTRVVVENPLPVLTVKDTSRNCPGTVTLTASSSPGAVISWYATADAASSTYTGTSYTTPEIDESTTYYAQARMTSTGCLSERKPVVAEVITEGCCHAPDATGITFAAFNPCSHTVGATYTLTDARDQKTYKVKYMPDNRWWMTQDLRFGSGCNKTAYKGSAADTETSNVDSSGLYHGDCRSGNSSSGYAYSRAAARSQNFIRSTATDKSCSGTSAGNSGANPSTCQGICPDGWHLPTSDELLEAPQSWATGFSTTKNAAWVDFNACGSLCTGQYFDGKFNWPDAPMLTSSSASNVCGYHVWVCCSCNSAAATGLSVRCVKNY
jgi:uncharacterized protein (TIGR02145 family)